MKSEQVINIIVNTLNHVDERLVNHGKRVAYLLYKVLSPLNKYNAGQLRDICMLALLHDVGAYKTEEIDRLTEFETHDVWEHSIYGHLFLKYFSPLKELSPVIMYHHANCSEIKALDNSEHRFLAQLISLCDRADVFSSLKNGNAGFIRHAEKNRDIKYPGDVIDTYSAAGINIDSIFDSVDTDTGFRNALYDMPMTPQESGAYIKMIISSIDFRSRYTVIHTAAGTCVAACLAEILGISSDAIERIKTGTMLHDIGKIGISVNILDYPGRLSDADMAVMRTHVELSAQILEGNIDDGIFRIAVNHHEKLDGSGYPNRLRGNEIGFYERIVTVADIFEALCGVRSYKEAFPKDKVIAILRDMSANSQLDPDIVEAAALHFDEISEELKNKSQPVMQAYDDIHKEYERIRENLAAQIPGSYLKPV